MNNAMKTCLFGGTLFAAGVAGQADAQITFELNVGGAYPTSFTTGYAYGLLSQYVSYSPGTSPVAPALAIGYGYVGYGYVSAGSMYATSYSYGSVNYGSGYQNAVGQAYAYFSVATPTDVTISWDFSNEFGAGSNYAFFSDISLTDWTNGGVGIFAVDPSLDPLTPLTGSTTISLSAGINYSLLLEASTGANTGSAWAHAVFTKVPTPASAAVLGLAGLVATRRRR
ncbi:MAG: hypothetical protein DHS20C14_18680 [Phycisphaeraceae bacterium]|nr:MAG: hypothetical protein DHS20C14_18680 [Phycisphaeraceae bacterium]